MDFAALSLFEIFMWWSQDISFTNTRCTKNAPCAI